MISLFAIGQEPNKKLIYYVAEKTTIAIQLVIVLAGDSKSVLRIVGCSYLRNSDVSVRRESTVV